MPAQPQLQPQLRLQLRRLLQQLTGADAIAGHERLQTLWSGYGEILRLRLDGGDRASVIVKRVAPPPHSATARHPRGWNTDRGHARKLRSYTVEAAWYTAYAPRCGTECRVPQALHVERQGDGWLFVLEDLDASGFDRRWAAHDAQLRHGVDWLAALHARFLDARPDGLWPTGTYWHLATRPDELDAMPSDHPLRRAADALDARLAACRHPTLVHGDAKVANFCFAADHRAAAVDFQYVGGGCGIKDLAYLLGSALDEDACERHAPALVDHYFDRLRDASPLPSADQDALEADWRALYPLAWADFSRFLVGWSPAHRKLHGYSARLTDDALHALDQPPHGS